MNRYIILTRIMLKNLNLLNLRPVKSGKSNIKRILITLLIFAAFLPMMLGIGNLAMSGYHVLSEIRQEGMILGIGFSLSSLAVFFFGIFYVMSFFYYSRDIESLLPLPLKPSEILSAKFTVTLFYEYLTEAIFLAPILTGFGIASKAGPVYYLYSILLFIALPILPLIYASVISMSVMGFTGLAKNKDRFRIVGGIAAMILAVAINTYITKLGSSSMSARELQELLEQGNNSYVKTMSGIFFSNRFAVMALLNSEALKGFVNLILFVLICILFIMLFISLGESIYFKGVAGMSEASAKRRMFSEMELERSSKQKPTLSAYTIKELKLLFRTPVYFMNCILMNFLYPVFIMLPLLIQPDEMKELQTLGTYIEDGRGSAVVLAAAFGISAFITSTNGIAASAISREGSNIFTCKYLPVSYKTQIMAKALSGISMGVVGTLSMLLAAAAFLPVPAYLLLLSAAAGSFGIVFSSFAGILIDLSFPKLIWDNEQKAVKQNFNVVLNMLISILIPGIPIFISIALRFTVWMTFLAIALIFGILDLLLYSILSTAGVRLFERIDA
jgi:ABC-2 type transport system permease protein